MKPSSAIKVFLFSVFVCMAAYFSTRLLHPYQSIKAAVESSETIKVYFIEYDWDDDDHPETDSSLVNAGLSKNLFCARLHSGPHTVVGKDAEKLRQIISSTLLSLSTEPSLKDAVPCPQLAIVFIDNKGRQINVYPDFNARMIWANSPNSDIGTSLCDFDEQVIEVEQTIQEIFPDFDRSQDN